MGSWYWLCTLVPMAFGFVVQIRLKKTVAQWMKVQAASGVTGAEAAQRILDAGGIGDKITVKFARGGPLSDHFNPGDDSVNLSKPVHNKRAIASLAIAGHECGHALQDSFGGGLYKVRSFMWPIVSLASSSWILLLAAGALFRMSGLVTTAIVLYGVTILFQVVTLPVELNASFGKDKALDQLLANGLLTPDEVPGARKVLRAAAMTYLAAAVAAVSQFLFFWLERRETARRRSAEREAREQRQAARQQRRDARQVPAAGSGRGARWMPGEESTRTFAGQVLGRR